MMAEKGGGRKGGGATAQGHVGTPVGRMQVTVHPHQVMGEACKEKVAKIK